MIRRNISLSVLFLCLGAAVPVHAGEAVPTDPADVRPLLIGAEVPSVTVRTVEGESVDLAAQVKGQPTVLLFYRGGWCPYCTRHLMAVGQQAEAIRELGVRIVAVSPDRPGKLAETVKEGVEYTLLSDSGMDAARAFGLAFKVDEPLVSKYKSEYDIDLEADSGETHHQLPVPAAFVLDAEGRIVFSHVNPDYRTRIDPDVLMAAVRAVAE